MLYLIGLGLGDEKDITVKGLEIIRKCNFIYLEAYTSKLQVDIKNLEDFYGKKVIPADRELVEKRLDEEIISKAKENDVALLIIGDVFSATTHNAVLESAKEKEVEVKIIHNTSILTVVGDTGLSLYKFGKTASIPFDNAEVEAPYDVLVENKDMHTLFLLDLNPLADKFMTVKEAIEYLLVVEAKRKCKEFDEESKCVGCAALGTDNAEIVYGTAKEVMKAKLTKFPQCLIVPGKLHFMEEEFLNTL
ncbi:MAG: diphthine synthase [Nanoarchaeota archaeon]|nr:diphthine synthase [Nanoarchaeota archaeon]MCG2719581.1 diphthine synthase [Nanoarchaeota archaeon]